MTNLELNIQEWESKGYNVTQSTVIFENVEKIKLEIIHNTNTDYFIEYWNIDSDIIDSRWY